MSYTDSSYSSRSPSPIHYPSGSEEDGQYSVMLMDTSISPRPSPHLFPMIIDDDDKTFYLSPLCMATPLPRCATPLICGRCLGYSPIPIPSRTPTPQLAIRSTRFPNRKARDWKKAAANLASMIGATMAECKLPMKQAVSRVPYFVYLALTPEESQKSEDSDESTLVSTSSSTSSSEDPVLPYTLADEEAARTFVSLSEEVPAPPPTPSSCTNEVDDEGHPAWTDDLDNSDHPYTPFRSSLTAPHTILIRRPADGSSTPRRSPGSTIIISPFPTTTDAWRTPCTFRYEVNAGRYPLLHATHGPKKATFNRLLRPCPVEVELRNSKYTPLQRHLFCHDEPFLNKVEEALNNIRDVTLRAGVYSARQHLKQGMLLWDAISKLDDQLATCLRHTEEAFTDLEQAGVFTCINLEIKWSEMEQDDFAPSEATKALDEVCGNIPTSRHPAPHPLHSLRPVHLTHPYPKSHKHRRLHCSKCHEKGHIRWDCPEWHPIVWDY